MVFYLLIFPHSHERGLLDAILPNILNLCWVSDSYFKEVKNLFYKTLDIIEKIIYSGLHKVNKEKPQGDKGYDISRTSKKRYCTG